MYYWLFYFQSLAYFLSVWVNSCTHFQPTELALPLPKHTHLSAVTWKQTDFSEVLRSWDIHDISAKPIWNHTFASTAWCRREPGAEQEKLVRQLSHGQLGLCRAGREPFLAAFRRYSSSSLPSLAGSEVTFTSAGIWMPHSYPPNSESAASHASKPALMKDFELDEESCACLVRQALPPHYTGRNR